MQVTVTVPCSDVSLVRTSLIVKHATVPDIIFADLWLCVCWRCSFKEEQGIASPTLEVFGVKVKLSDDSSKRVQSIGL